MASSPTSRCSRRNDRVFTPAFERCKRFLAHEADCPKKVSPPELRDTCSLYAVTRRASLLAVLLPLLYAAAGFLPRTIVRGRVAAQTRREYQAKLGFGALIRRLHGGADRGRPCERHCGRRHRRGRPLRLRRKRFGLDLPVLADRRGPERGTGALPLHE